MRYIEDLRDKHVGKQIWIIGSGPSLDDFPDNFFKDKIFIVVNLSIRRFPPKEECQYAHWYHKVHFDYVEEKNPEIFKRTIALIPSGEGMDSPDNWGEFKDVIPIWMKWGTGANEAYIEAAAKAIIEGNPCLYTGMGSVIHTAIQAAFVMGACSVVLCGCEHKVTKEKKHGYKGGMDIYKEHEGKISFDTLIKCYENIRRGTCAYAKAFAKYGRMLKRYYYPTGYKEIGNESG